MQAVKRNDPSFREMIGRIRSGELTRKQAAAAYGITTGLLNVWIQRSKITGLPRDTEWRQRNPDKVKELADHLIGKPLSPEVQALMDAAVARVLAGEVSARAAAAEDPRLSHRTLARNVRRERLKAGLPVQFRTPPSRELDHDLSPNAHQ